MAKLKHDFIDAHNGMRHYKAGDEATGVSKEGMAFLKEKGYLDEAGKAGADAGDTKKEKAKAGGDAGDK